MMLQGKYRDRLLAVAGCLLVAVSMAAGAATRTWDGDTSTNWFDNLNWVEGFYPVATDDVSVPSGTPNAPTLTNETGNLNSFALASGQTLTVLGWTSEISAVTMTISGTLTHGANLVTTTNALGQWVPIHRVLLGGSNITIAATGRIDADYLGYPPGAGPGGGWGTYGPGAAHAGPGVRGFGGALPTSQPYGDPAAPEQPGSGGGTHGNSRPGGGAVKIVADGLLTVDGEIRAKGQNYNSTHGSGGAGGSIWLSCRTFAGAATGLVAVDGGNGNYYGPQGSAGRIALHYDESAQASLPQPNPPVRFSGAPGAHFSVKASDDFGAMSTLYLPDTQFIDGTFEGQRFRYTRLVIPGFTSSWSRTSLTLNNCVIGLPVGMDLVVTNDLIVTNGGGLHVWAAPVGDPLTEDGALVTVGNDLRVESGSWIHPYCDTTNGATVRFVVSNDLFVADTGGFDADYTGYAIGYGPGKPPNAASGAGHGGTGGSGGYSQFRGAAYGDPAGPIQAGSGAAAALKSGQGGGAINLQVTGKAEIHGLLTARGAMGMYSHGAAGSGGGIRIACSTIEGSNTGLLRVDGGQGSLNGGCGGGGRIAVIYNAAAQVALPDPRPPVRFSSHVYLRSTTIKMNHPARMGTVYFPDMTLLTPSAAAAVVLDRHRFWYVRPIFGDDGLDTWAPASLVVSNCVIGFPEGFDMNVSGDLTVASGGTLPSDLRLEPAHVVFGDPAGPRGGFYMAAIQTNTLYGARLDVGGDLHIGTNSWIFPATCGSNEAVVGIFVGGSGTVDAGGGISADDSGYMSLAGNNNGAGAGQSAYASAGGYGGAGGGTGGGITYGLAELPLEPGSPAGYNVWGGGDSLGGVGGGAIHVQARGYLTIDGTLSANGHKGNYYRGGGGSGGSIFLSCKDISGSGLLTAQGATGDQGGTTDAYGGGGRIAVWYTPIPQEIPERIAETNLTKLVYSYPYAGFSGALDVSAGGGVAAEDGTRGFYFLPPPRGTMFILR